MEAKSSAQKIAVALDTPDWARFVEWCDLWGPRVGVLKVGLEAFARWGPRAVEKARGHGARVFLDIKLHDIPNTVAGAVSAARALGVDYVTIHALGGRRMLEAAATAADGEVTLLGVTALTSMDEVTLSELGLAGSVEDRVQAWAKLAVEAGCGGVVCSPREADRLRRALGATTVLVTPGIRPAGTSSDDQRRVATPSEALAAGSDLLVIGRPLTRAGEPLDALRELVAEMDAR